METFDEPGITATFAAAVAEAEELIRTAPFIRTEQDLLEGYDYLSGRMRTAIAAAFSADPGRTLFVNATHQFARQGWTIRTPSTSKPPSGTVRPTSCAGGAARPPTSASR